MDIIDSYALVVDKHYWLVVFGLFLTGQALIYNIRVIELRNSPNDEYNFVIDNYFPISIVLGLWSVFWYVTVPFTLIGITLILVSYLLWLIIR